MGRAENSSSLVLVFSVGGRHRYPEFMIQHLCPQAGLIKPKEFANVTPGFAQVQEHLDRLNITPSQILLWLEVISCMTFAPYDPESFRWP